MINRLLSRNGDVWPTDVWPIEARTRAVREFPEPIEKNLSAKVIEHHTVDVFAVIAIAGTPAFVPIADEADGISGVDRIPT